MSTHPWRPLTFSTAFLLVAVTHGDNRLVNVVGRLTIAVAFLLALCVMPLTSHRAHI